MDYVALKRETLQQAIKKHQQVIDDFRVRINDMLNAEPITNEDQLDYGSQAKTAEAIITRINPLGDQLEFANEEMKLLFDMLAHQDDVHDNVELGSIVVTDKDTFFVSASIERFSVNGKSMFGLSTKTPLYEMMKGKKEGETFSYKDRSYTIQEIF